MAEREIPENAVKRHVKPPASIGEYCAMLARRYKYKADLLQKQALRRLRRQAGEVVSEDEEEDEEEAGMSEEFPYSI